jgi:site-specific recombinase XerD
MKTSDANLTVSFYLKKKILRNGLCPVLGRITIGKDMVQFSCKLEANPTFWDARAGRVNGKSHHARTVNREIDKINVAVNAKYKEIISLRGNATPDEVKNAFQGISASQETLLKIFMEHNEVYKKQAGVDCSIRTWENYEYNRTNLAQFINHKYHVTDLHFRQLNFSFIEDYNYYLRVDCKMMTSTALQNMTSLRKIVKIAIRRRIISRDPFFGYEPERPKTCQRYVPEEEMEKLMKTYLKSPALEVTRDMFIFSCFTGLAYIDLFNLTNDKIVKTDDGTSWLSISRQKTDNESKIPLLDIALQMIEKYKGKGSGDKVFPMRGCGLMNGHLKKIAQLCGIDRRLTFHMSRHTFATETCLSQGVPIETVSRMMGHIKLSTTQLYAKVTPNKVNEEMILLDSKINRKYVLAS